MYLYSGAYGTFLQHGSLLAQGPRLARKLSCAWCMYRATTSCLDPESMQKNGLSSTLGGLGYKFACCRGPGTYQGWRLSGLTLEVHISTPKKGPFRAVLRPNSPPW